MAKGKYKKRHKFVNINGNELYFMSDKRINEDVINEIRKYDENGKVENEYKKLIDGINFNKYDFFDNYVNTIANHIIGRIYTSYLNFKLEKVKEYTLKTKKQLLDEIGFNGNKTIAVKETSPKKAENQDAIVVKEQSKNINDDLIFLKKKAILLNDAKTIEEVVDTANQILKLAEILGG